MAACADSLKDRGHIVARDVGTDAEEGVSARGKVGHSDYQGVRKVQRLCAIGLDFQVCCPVNGQVLPAGDAGAVVKSGRVLVHQHVAGAEVSRSIDQDGLSAVDELGVGKRMGGETVEDKRAAQISKAEVGPTGARVGAVVDLDAVVCVSRGRRISRATTN